MTDVDDLIASRWADCTDQLSIDQSRAFPAKHRRRKRDGPRCVPYKGIVW
jgi:hypothetical protein